MPTLQDVKKSPVIEILVLSNPEFLCGNGAWANLL
jgi:hypothetical protein